jgi:Lrp/AsnC family transcriptional regulator for asnA, asnC and gidA
VAAKIESKSRRGTDATYDDALDRGPIERPTSIDRLDREIIEALQVNGREPFRRIAAQLGVSEATVRNRYARLVRENVLQVTGVTNPLGLGFDAQAMVGIKTNGPVQEVADEVAGWREASYVVIAAGQYDILVELVCADRRHLLEIINRIRGLESVVSTESFIYLELWKQLYDWGTAPEGDGSRRQGKRKNGERRSR